MTSFEQAYSEIAVLVAQFEANEAHYLSPKYQEAEVREDYINKFWTSLGWDVRHTTQTNPREQEVKVEKNPDASASGRRADYAFYHKPDYKNPVFFVEAKKPSRKLSDPEFYFQLVRYGRGASTPVSVLTDFEEFHIVDCRYEANRQKSYPSAQIAAFRYKDYLDREKFGSIYWLFSREAVEAGKLKEFSKSLPKQRGKGAAKLTADEAKPTDEAFLTKLEEYRLALAKAFKKADETLDAEALTEATQKVIDRLVFIRFLEDKNIEQDYIIDQIAGKKNATWKSFLAWSKELDVKYNGIVFKPNQIDKPTFKAPDDAVFGQICTDISHSQSKYIFSYIPIELLGSIYERFLGKVVTATAKRADIEYKPEVRKAGGVYYTPKYIVDYIVENTVGKILRNAGVPPASPDESEDAGETPALPFKIRSRGYLPHYEQQGSTYFVTFRLADSLPKEKLIEFKQLLSNAGVPPAPRFTGETRSAGILPAPSDESGDAGETPALRRKHAYQQKILEYLDRGAGQAFMNNPRVADIVEQALLHFDKTRYDLYAWAVMPNHVHVVFRPFENEKLEKILHSWKSFTSKEANKLLGRSGPFWQEEYYDHLVRSEKELLNTIEYVVNNPVAANLRQWKWAGFGDIYSNAGVPPAPPDKTATRSAGILPAPRDESEDAGGTPALRGLTPKEISKLRFADIACGSGSFLIAVYDKVLHHIESYYNAHPDEAQKAGCIEIDKGIYALSLKQKQQILLDNIFGVDIDSQAVEVAQLSLFLKLLEGESGASAGQMSFEKTKILPDLSKNIVCGNSLVDYDILDAPLFTDRSAGVSPAPPRGSKSGQDAPRGSKSGQDARATLTPEEEHRIKPFSFESAFKDVMAKGGFDAIVGNPPYVRQESLGELKNYFQKHYKVFQGTADLYTYFIERGVSLLKPAGRFSYIVGNKWMKTSYGVELRKWLKFQALEEVIDFADLQVFKGATTYTCILTIKKDKPSDLIRAANVETLLFGNLESYLSNKKFDIHFNILTDSGWSLTNKSTSDLLSKMKETGVHLGDLVGGKIFRGLITGLNEAFVISAEKRNELLTLDVRSDEIIKPFLAGRDIKRYEHLTSEKYIITIPSGYTNSHRDGKDSWTWFANTYPAIATHLKPFEKAAQARWDKGEYWWELRSCDYYNEFEKPKLFLPDISQRGNFAIDNSGGFFSVNTVYFISSDDLFLMGVLNSRLMTFFYSNNFSVYSGGYLRFFTQYLKLLPIPNLDLTNPLDKSRHDGLVSLVDQMLEAKKRLAVARSESERTQLERKCAHLDHEIDKRVYELYDLTDEEIGIVEGNV